VGKEEKQDRVQGHGTKSGAKTLIINVLPKKKKGQSSASLLLAM
jgi:hypothetical protein